MLRQLRYRCPDCNAKLKPIDALNTATQVVTRKCACGARWSLVVEPKRIPGGYTDTAIISRKSVLPYH